MNGSIAGQHNTKEAKAQFLDSFAPAVLRSSAKFLPVNKKMGVIISKLAVGLVAVVTVAAASVALSKRRPATDETPNDYNIDDLYEAGL